MRPATIAELQFLAKRIERAGMELEALGDGPETLEQRLALYDTIDTARERVEELAEEEMQRQPLWRGLLFMVLVEGLKFFGWLAGLQGLAMRGFRWLREH